MKGEKGWKEGFLLFGGLMNGEMNCEKVFLSCRKKVQLLLQLQARAVKPGISCGHQAFIWKDGVYYREG